MFVGRSLARWGPRGTRFAIHEAQSACGHVCPRCHVWDAACWEPGLGYPIRLSSPRVYEDEQQARPSPNHTWPLSRLQAPLWGNPHRAGWVRRRLFWQVDLRGPEIFTSLC
jgi:hypothetical protein